MRNVEKVALVLGMSLLGFAVAAGWLFFRPSSPIVADLEAGHGATYGKQPGTTQVTSATAPGKLRHELELALVSEGDFGGYRIFLPKGYATVTKNLHLDAFTYREAGEFITYDIAISALPQVTTLAAAEKTVSERMSIVETTNALGRGDYLVTTRPVGVTQVVYAFKPAAASTTLLARCSGPAAAKEKLAEICASLLPGK